MFVYDTELSCGWNVVFVYDTELWLRCGVCLWHWAVTEMWCVCLWHWAVTEMWCVYDTELWLKCGVFVCDTELWLKCGVFVYDTELWLKCRVYSLPGCACPAWCVWHWAVTIVWWTGRWEPSGWLSSENWWSTPRPCCCRQTAQHSGRILMCMQGLAERKTETTFSDLSCCGGGGGGSWWHSGMVGG